MCECYSHYLSEIDQKYLSLLKQSKRQNGTESVSTLIKVSFSRLKIALTDLDLALSKEGDFIESMEDDERFNLYMELRQVVPFGGKLGAEELQTCLDKIISLELPR